MERRQQMEKKVFAEFDDILYVDDITMRSAVLKVIDLLKDLPGALKDATPAIKGKFFRNIGRKITQQVLLEMDIRSGIPRSMIEEARGNIVEIIKRLQSSGQIALSDTKDEREEGSDVELPEIPDIAELKDVDDSTPEGIIKACFHLAIVARREGIPGLETAAKHLKNEELKEAVSLAGVTPEPEDLEEMLNNKYSWAYKMKEVELQLICEGTLRVALGEPPAKIVERLRSMLPPGIGSDIKIEEITRSPLPKSERPGGSPYADIIVNMYNTAIITRREGIPGLEKAAEELREEFPLLSEMLDLASVTPEVEDLRYLIEKKNEWLLQYEKVRLDMMREGVLRSMYGDTPGMVVEKLRSLLPPPGLWE